MHAQSRTWYSKGFPAGAETSRLRGGDVGGNRSVVVDAQVSGRVAPVAVGVVEYVLGRAGFDGAPAIASVTMAALPKTVTALMVLDFPALADGQPSCTLTQSVWDLTLRGGGQQVPGGRELAWPSTGLELRRSRTSAGLHLRAGRGDRWRRACEHSWTAGLSRQGGPDAEPLQPTRPAAAGPTRRPFKTHRGESFRCGPSQLASAYQHAGPALAGPGSSSA